MDTELERDWYTDLDYCHECGQTIRGLPVHDKFCSEECEQAFEAESSQSDETP